jgi:large subunit ribosomal protein L23
MSVIISPILSEKTVANMDKGLYVFAVAADATKNSIAQELKKFHDVDSVSVRIVNLPAKKVSFRRRPGTRSVRRRAYVQLSHNQTIPGFELPKQKEDKKEKGK